MSLYSAPLLQTAAGYAPGNVENAKNRGIFFVFCVFRYLDVELQVWGGGFFVGERELYNPDILIFYARGRNILTFRARKKKKVETP